MSRALEFSQGGGKKIKSKSSYDVDVDVDVDVVLRCVWINYREQRREGLEKKQMEHTRLQTIFTFLTGAWIVFNSYVSKSIETYLMEFIDGNDDGMLSREEVAAGVQNGMFTLVACTVVMTLITIAVIARVFGLSLTLT